MRTFEVTVQNGKKHTITFGFVPVILYDLTGIWDNFSIEGVRHAPKEDFALVFPILDTKQKNQGIDTSILTVAQAKANEIVSKEFHAGAKILVAGDVFAKVRGTPSDELVATTANLAFGKQSFPLYFPGKMSKTSAAYSILEEARRTAIKPQKVAFCFEDIQGWYRYR